MNIRELDNEEYDKAILLSPVSYTHLYNSGSEEQFWLSVFSGKPIILDRQGNKSSAFIRHSFISVIGTIPVSYTHLDVYKRQK